MSCVVANVHCYELKLIDKPLVMKICYHVHCSVKKWQAFCYSPSSLLWTYLGCKQRNNGTVESLDYDRQCQYIYDNEASGDNGHCLTENTKYSFYLTMPIKNKISRT